jgi:hypothetical protein
MKKPIFNTLLGLALVCSSMLYAQDILWEKSFGGKQAEYLSDAIPSADYGFILAGSSLTPNDSNPSSKGNYDYSLWKVKEDGNIEWQKNYGGSGNDFLYSVKATSDGGIILVGTSNSAIGGQKKDKNIGQNDIWMLKLDASGNELWQKTIGGISDEQVSVVLQTKEGGFLIGASSESDFCKFKQSETNKNSIYKSEDGNGSLDYWLLKLNAKGELEWQKTIGGNYIDQLKSVVATSDGGYFVGGISNSNSCSVKQKDGQGQLDFWYMKLDAKGNIVWEKTYGGAGDDNLYTVLETKNHQLLVAGNTNSATTPKGNTTVGSDIMVLQLEQDGHLNWEKTYNISNQDILTNVIQNEDGSLVFCGYSRDDSQFAQKENKKRSQLTEGIEDYVVIKTDNMGEEIWRKICGSKGKDVLNKAIETRDGGYLLAGTSMPIPVNNISNNNKGYKGKQNQSLQNATSEVNQSISQTTNEANTTINDATKTATNSVKEALGITDNSPLKVNSPVASLGAPSLGSGNVQTGGNSNSKAAKIAIDKNVSRDKSSGYGASDFWVVKLKDKAKPEKVKQSIEALPNPALTYTNVIVGYEFESGTASVYDLAGRQLQSFAITSRTVPIDLSPYPEGIYIINIDTNVQKDGVKVIKGNNKN